VLQRFIVERAGRRAPSSVRATTRPGFSKISHCAARVFQDAPAVQAPSVRAVSRRRKPHLRCAECRMHQSLCICALLPRLETRTRVVLLLHQLEVVKPTNTGLVAARCLVNSAVVYRGRAPGGDAAEPEARDGGPSLSDQARRLAAELPAGSRAALLFPHPSAVPLDAFAPDGAPVALVVPDGTWSQAARARSRLAPALALPCVTLPTGGADDAGSPGRLRTPTRPGRLATLEALARALGVLEGPAIEAELLRVYRVMTDRTLWTNGRLSRDAVTGGVPAGLRSHDPLGAPRAVRRDRRTRAEP
jgi:DTW domain-containing protein YfiP